MAAAGGRGMCGVAGAVALGRHPVPRLDQVLAVMSTLIAHRGPDGSGFWRDRRHRVGFVHRRLAIIDPSPAGHQPMLGPNGSVITYNGQVYNYTELMEELKSGWVFRSRSDTEAVLAAYDKWGPDCLDHLRGMFGFAIWDGKRLFAARDRFGIKPFYYTTVDGVFYFASEVKALLPVLPDIVTDSEALAEYLTFQYTIGDRNLFKRVHTLLPGHALVVENGSVRTFRYWSADREIDRDHDHGWFCERMNQILEDSIAMHLRSDVAVGAYASGGFDSSLVAILAANRSASSRIAFHGKFTDYPGYDESPYAEILADGAGLCLQQRTITSQDFTDVIEKTIYHLDHPVAGPGAFPQYVVSALAGENVKVVLGGQGGDEIFGGYARYVIACFEQHIKSTIHGNAVSGISAAAPDLSVLREYQPLLRQFLSKGMLGSLDQRYFSLIDRSGDMDGEVDWTSLDRAGVFERFCETFNRKRGGRAESDFESMTRFDFDHLLPALLQVEDRMSMAHGVESRVPLLDTAVVEFVATIPAELKFGGGQLKHFFRSAFSSRLPRRIAERSDKMGFPVPLNEWFSGPLRGFVRDLFAAQRARHRPFFNGEAILAHLDGTGRYSRKTWGLLCLELWYQQFHDRAAAYRRMIDDARPGLTSSPRDNVGLKASVA
jgi:asparagine synthase (glutamine-hydrolysing)